MINMKKPTKPQIKEAVEYLKRWDKKTVLKFGYWFKLINNNQVEIFNEKENEFIVVGIK